MTLPPLTISTMAGVAALFLALGCQAEAALDDGATAESDESGAPTPPELLAEPQVIWHPHQPMVIDVIVELDRAGVIELTHDSDPGVRTVSLAIEDDGRLHHLRVRGLAPASDHAMTLVLRDPMDA